MTKQYENILELTKKLCRSTERVSNFSCVPTNRTYDIAHEILEHAGIDKKAHILEIPLCWDDQVCIRFQFPEYNDLKYADDPGRERAESFRPIIFNLLAGLSTTDKTVFFLEINVESDYKSEVVLFSDALDL